jgi:hypothetical protein
MIALSFKATLYDSTAFDDDAAIKALMARYRALPTYIAKKHMKAAMRRVIKPGVSILRKNTPPLDTRVGRRRKGEKRRSTGDLRRAATTRVGQTGNNATGFVWAVLGYRAGLQSRKAIWLESGTSNGVRPFRMMEKTLQSFRQPATQLLAKELALALDKAVKELASGRNPGVGASGFGPGRG